VFALWIHSKAPDTALGFFLLTNGQIIRYVGRGLGYPVRRLAGGGAVLTITQQVSRLQTHWPTICPETVAYNNNLSYTVVIP
jgi:hypothetical protein